MFPDSPPVPYHHPEVIHYFRFLTEEYGYTGPILWKLAFEAEHTYLKGPIFVNISYDGGFSFTIGKGQPPLPTSPESPPNHARTKRLVNEEYELRLLVPIEFNVDMYLGGRRIDDLSSDERQQVYEMSRAYESPKAVAQLLREHPRVLEGDFGELKQARKRLPGLGAFLWSAIRRAIRKRARGLTRRLN